MNAPMPPFPTNPYTGQYFGIWVYNGQMWVQTSAGFRQVVQVFTASGVYTPSPGLATAVVECIGGGGGGGGVYAGVANLIVGGGGGGSGGYSRKTLDASLVAGGVIVTVGAGGPPEDQGGTTSFGALCVALGGYGGTPNNGTTEFGNGGSMAGFGTGDFTQPGASGAWGVTDSPPAGAPADMVAPTASGGWIFGGNTQHAVGANAAIPGSNGAPGTGAGGSGAVCNQLVLSAGSPQLGGLGGSGVCVVSEYCSVTGFGGSCGQAPIPANCGPGWGGPC